MDNRPHIPRLFTDDEINKYLEELFATQGWGIVVDEARERVEALKEALLYTNSWEESLFIKGQIYVLREIMYKKDTHYKTKDEEQSLEEAV